MSTETTPEQEKPLHKNEGIKVESAYLRGTIAEGLADTSTGALADSDTQLTKFHGIYQQDDRDLRKERRKAKLEKAFSFMIRVRVPGGVCTPKQWLEIDELASTYANEAIKLTTRQAFQLHGVLKGTLKRTIKEINDTLLDTLAACGDVNRNVMCNPNPYQSVIHEEVQEITQKISDHLSPRTSAYHEIWLDKERVTPEPVEEEPLYGKTYLPRKFKTVVAVPPSNDVDIFAHDLGYIAIVEDDKLVGFNVTVGGGMGMAHGKVATYPQLAQVIGFCTKDQVVDVAEKIVSVQRDYGDRVDRAHARLKYTIEDHGLDWFRDQVEERLGYKFGEQKPFQFDHNGDRYGWVEGVNGRWHYTLFVQNGRVRDTDGQAMRTALREIAKIHDGDFRLTANQNVIIANVSAENKPAIEKALEASGLGKNNDSSALRLNSMACVALPTCGLALAESERYLPDLVTQLDTVIEDAGLREDAITIRMTGCPNGCARPYLAEIAMVGRAPGKYNLYLGGGFVGDRLNKLYRESVKSDELVETLKPMIESYAKEREDGERFGDFVIRKDIIKATSVGADFHQNLGETKS